MQRDEDLIKNSRVNLKICKKERIERFLLFDSKIERPICYRIINFIDLTNQFKCTKNFLVHCL